MVFFEDSFDREGQPGPDWAVLSGRFGITCDQEKNTGVMRGKGQSLIWRQFPGDVRVELEVSSEDPGDLSIILATADGGHSDGYLLAFGSEGNTLSKILRRRKKVAESKAVATPGVTHRIVAEKCGGLVTMHVDGKEILRFVDPAPLSGPGHEMVGLYFWNTASVNTITVHGEKGREPIAFPEPHASANMPVLPPLPDYRWVVEEQRVIVTWKEIGEDAPESEHEPPKSVYPEGLTFARNGDLLLAACCPPARKTVIMRSADRGKTWSKQGELEHRAPPECPGVESWGGTTEGMAALRSGRLAIVYFTLNHKDSPIYPGDEYYVPGGSNTRFTHSSSTHWGAYSDDEGKTWQYAPMDVSPFQSVDFEASTQIFEAPDGTLVASFQGHLDQAEMDAGLSSNGLVRSHDSGLTWGDASVIHRAQPGSGLWYNENQIVPLPDGRWLCMMRLNNGNFHRKGPLTMCRSYSRDQGYTWSYPVRTRFHGGEPGMGFLPDGAVCCMQRGGISMSQTTTEDDIIVHGFDKEGSKYLYEVSYDGGMTWPYWGDLYLTEPGSTEHVGSAIIRPLDAESAIAVYHRGIKALCEKYPPDRPQLIGASWLRKVPDDDPRAGSLRYAED